MIRLFRELSRRNVYRALAAYAVGGWVAIEFITTVAAPLGFPDWIDRLAIGVFLLGFPVTFLLSWFYVWGDGGIRSQDDLDAAGEIEDVSFGRLFDFVIIILLAGAVGFLLWERTQTPAVFALPQHRVAVLPFVDLSPRKSADDIGGDVAIEIARALTSTNRIAVSGETSAFQFRDAQLELREIAQRLEVGAVLEGTLERFGGQLRLTAQLVSGQEGLSFWSSTVEGEAQDMRSLVTGLAAQAAEQLVPDVELPQNGDLLANRSPDASAYQTYLRGLSWERMLGTERGFELGAMVVLNNAADQFAYAAVLDEGFALALARQAYAVALSAENNWGDRLLTDAIAEVDRVTAQATALAAQDPEVLSLVGLALYATGRVNEAFETLEQTVASTSALPEAVAALARLQERRGQYAAAWETMQQAFVLDPLNIEVRHDYHRHLLSRGRYDEAEALIGGMPEPGVQDGGHWISQMMPANFAYYMYGRLDQYSALQDRTSTWIETRTEEQLQALEMPAKADPDSLPAWIQLRNVEVLLTLDERSAAVAEAGERFADTLAAAEGNWSAASQAMFTLWDALDESRAVRQVWQRTDELVWPLMGFYALQSGDEAAFVERLEAAGLNPGIPMLPQYHHQSFNLPWGETSFALALQRLGRTAEAAQWAESIAEQVQAAIDAGIVYPKLYYELARALAISAEQAQALTALQTAITRGYRHWLLFDDPTLHSLVNEPAFAQMLAEYEADVRNQRTAIQIRRTRAAAGGGQG